MRGSPAQSGSKSGRIGGGGGGWASGWGGSGGGVKMPSKSRTAYCGKSAGKIAGGGMSAKSQRAVVKMSYHKMGMAAAHTRYLEREGAGLEQSTTYNHVGYLERDAGGLEHERGQALDLHTGKPIDAAAKVERWEREHDAYHWRGIIAGERTPEDMTAMIQEVTAKAEVHLGTRLDGFMVHHHGQGNPHTHIVFRGRHENGKALYIDPVYVQHGFRDSAQQYITREFGERSDREIAAGQERSWEIAQQREQGLERVREYTQEHGLDDKDRLRLKHTMLKGSVKEIEQTHRKLDALERVQEIEQELPQERRQELERKVLDGSARQVAAVERQVQQVEQRVERVRERSRDRGMDMGL
ncbi:hypothetical protein SAE02_74750 [Skermanella aerolata]|uniref:Uncharacterized protein n=2 Tax=Skermanella aerolata TaxID=393310 RepID=A0A512E3Q2_9PROT|nr:hypothetical protein SAE02_74750 [Skermanella aerolata]